MPDKDAQLLSEAYEAVHKPASTTKVKRDIFIYLDPQEPKDKFAQCETCEMWTDSKRNRCSILGESNVTAGMSCGLYVHGDPTPDQETAPTYKPEDVGLVDHQVRCENCGAYDPKRGVCEEFEMLNQKIPHMFDLDPKVNAKGCCNTWHPITSSDKTAKS